MTPREGRAWKNRVAKELERDLKRRARAHLADLRAQLRAAKAERKQRAVDARTICKSGRVAARERAKQLRIDAREALRQAIALERQAARDACSAAKGVAATLGDEVARRRETFHAERVYQKQLRRIEAANRASRRQEKRASAVERRSESDDEVRANLPPELLALFERVRGKIRGNAYKSRTEAMLEYAETHPAEIIVSQTDAEGDVIAELERRQAEAEDVARRPRRYIRKTADGWTSEVPF